MIDPEWLEGLRFQAIEDVRVTGLAGIGTEKVVLTGEDPIHGKIVLKLPRTMIGLHINEIPPTISATRIYDLDRVNSKLAKLVGNGRLDMMSLWYDRLYSMFVKILSEHGVGGLIFSNMLDESVQTIPFLLGTGPIERRLREIVEWPVSDDDPLSRMPVVNGEFPIRLYIGDKPVPWAVEGLKAIETMAGYARDMSPATALANPLIVWGAAALEGFFSDDEMPLVARFLTEKYGSFTGRDDTLVYLEQANAFANLCAQYTKNCPVDRFVKLCAKAGLVFQAVDRSGEVVASGFADLGS